MAGKKDRAVVMVITDVTNAQAARIVQETIKIKNKIAPSGRGTIAARKKEDVGRLIQKASRRAITG